MDVIIDQFPKVIRERLKNRIKKIFLFGSRARGDFNPRTSDYDFLIIVDKKNKFIEEEVFNEKIKLEDKYDELITSIVWDEEEAKDYFRYPIGINIKNQGKEI